MKKFGYLLFGLGIIIAAFGLSMDTTVETDGQTIGRGDYSVTVPNSRVHNLGLMDDRRTILYGASLSLLLGAIFIGFGTLSENGQRGQSTAHQETASKQELSPLQKFSSGAIISSKEVEGLAELARHQPSIVVATNRSNGNSLLHLSALYGLRDAAALLLKAGAERKRRNGNGQRPYQLAKDAVLSDLLRGEG
ncbi:MAG: hypothetical protein JWO49_2884 [Arthrobacter sp.]|jgi:hypothetical protein|nr:hypothetical protein [Arthrobacter sp.]